MTGSIAIVFGLIVLCLVLFLLIKQVETRTVLIGAGFLMGIAALDPSKIFDAFSTQMVQSGLIQNICTTLGFAMVLQLTACDKHLIYTMAKVLSKVRIIIIPGVVLSTFFINIALPSAAGCAAAVGVIMIPLLISMGIAPAVSASAVMLGTFGSMLSPGLMHNPMIAKIANIGVIDVIQNHAPATIVSVVIGAISLTIIAMVRKEDKGYTSDEFAPANKNFKVNPFFAILPLIPVALLVIFSIDSVGEAMPWTKSIKVPHVMLFGSFVCMLLTRTSPQKAVQNFFDGMGKGYGDVMGIIIAAGVFVAGMSALGMINAFIELLKYSDGVVKIASTYGPFILGVVSGSGDAAAIAFNEAGSVTSHANEFGMQVSQMGSLAALAGALGRTMSPLAGAAIICAGIAKVNPIELTKRIAPGMIIASIVSMIMLTFI